jgi:hypothetical protein
MAKRFVQQALTSLAPVGIADHGTQIERIFTGGSIRDRRPYVML